MKKQIIILLSIILIILLVKRFYNKDSNIPTKISIGNIFSNISSNIPDINYLQNVICTLINSSNNLSSYNNIVKDLNIDALSSEFSSDKNSLQNINLDQYMTLAVTNQAYVNMFNTFNSIYQKTPNALKGTVRNLIVNLITSNFYTPSTHQIFRPNNTFNIYLIMKEVQVGNRKEWIRIIFPKKQYLKTICNLNL